MERYSGLTRKKLAGGHDISFSMPESASRADIEKKFRELQESDRLERGHQEGYSGDFQTVNSIDWKHSGKKFTDFNEAYDFALDHAEKWETLVAVKTPTRDGSKEIWLVAGWAAS